MVPLIEERRAITLFNGAPRQPMLILTLRNNNNFAVDFFAITSAFTYEPSATSWSLGR